MKRILHRWLLLISLSSTLASKDPELPLCPANIQYFPQSLPMHCRMPGNSEQRPFPEMQQFPTLPPMPQSFYQSPPPNKQPPPVPIPIPPFPGMPGAMPMPGPMGGPMGGPVPGMPGPMPMPMPMVGGPPHKLPVIVMPFYSPDNTFKKPQIPHRVPKKKPPRKKKKPSYDSDTDKSSDETSSDDTSDNSHSSDEHGFWKGRRKARKKMTRRFNKRHKSKKRERKNKKKDLLTPILQYVTKDGYVIFEKKITKSEAKDWLKPKNEVNEVEEPKRDEKDQEIIQRSNEEPRSPKVVVEEISKKIEERSKESVEEVISTTQRVSPRRHRVKKPSALMSKPDFMP